jgi:hypothetical protein
MVFTIMPNGPLAEQADTECRMPSFAATIRDGVQGSRQLLLRPHGEHPVPVRELEASGQE